MVARRAATYVALTAAAGWVLLPGAEGSTASGTERRVDTTVRLAVQPDQAIAGEKVAMRTRLQPAVARRVVLQRRAGDRWVKVVSALTSSDGRHVFRQVTPLSTTAYRVRAPKARTGGHSYGADTSPRRALVVERQDVVLRLPDSASTGEEVTAVAEVFPRRAGRPVVLQRRVGDAWSDVAFGAQNGNGIVSWQVVMPEPGEVVHRALVASHRGADAVWSLAARTTVVE